MVNHLTCWTSWITFAYFIFEKGKGYTCFYMTAHKKSFDDFDLRLNKRWSKQARRWTFETPSRSLVRHYNVLECTLQSINWVDNGAYMCDGHRTKNILGSVCSVRLHTFSPEVIPPGQNGDHFAADIFRRIFVNENSEIWLKIHRSLFLRVQLTIT